MMTETINEIAFRHDFAQMAVNGLKTQTRRPVKPQPPERLKHGAGNLWDYGAGAHFVYCPYGSVGDKLRIKDYPYDVLLRITGIRCESIQEISNQDIMAEGIYNNRKHSPQVSDDPWECFEQAFIDVWDSIYTGEFSFCANPWVWVIEFELLSNS